MKFLDLYPQYIELKKEIDKAVKEVLARGNFILGQDVRLFEEEFARYCAVKYAVGVNSGTDALFLGLLSLGIGWGDEVIVPAFTYIATALAVTFTGAKPVFADIQEETFNIEPRDIKKRITRKTKAVIPVHLYGQPADMNSIIKIAREYNLKIIEDAAQAHGARYRISSSKWQKTGSMGDIGAFSFYPTKNLAAFGDGGMVVTNNDKTYRNLLMLRDYGRKSRYEHVMVGYNSRLDTLQAAILRVKLRRLDKWNALRRQKAKLYTKLLSNIRGIITPCEKPDFDHVYHTYVIRTKNRDKLCNTLQDNGIPFLIYYPIPLHLQPVYKNLGVKKGSLPVAEKLANEVLSLPLHPYLKDNEIKSIANIICKDFVG